jgi:hypothetical protein
MATAREDAEALVRECEAMLADATPEMRVVLQQQIDAVRSAMALLDAAAPNLQALKEARPLLSDELRKWFTPEPCAAVPVWIPDGIRRREMDPRLLRCPEGANVYDNGDDIGCAIPRGPGQIPMMHGLQLLFWTNGHLKAQRFYDQRLLRWAIEYHPSGGRASAGFYADSEPLVHLEQGLQTSYAPNGTITGQTHFENGVRQGWSKLWEEDGFPIGSTRYQNGSVVESVYPDGTRRKDA